MSIRFDKKVGNFKLLSMSEDGLLEYYDHKSRILIQFDMDDWLYDVYNISKSPWKVINSGRLRKLDARSVEKVVMDAENLYSSFKANDSINKHGSTDLTMEQGVVLDDIKHNARRYEWLEEFLYKGDPIEGHWRGDALEDLMGKKYIQTRRDKVEITRLGERAWEESGFNRGRSSNVHIASRLTILAKELMAQGQWGLKWTEDKGTRQLKKQKDFSSESARDKFIEKREKADVNFSVESLSDPK